MGICGLYGASSNAYPVPHDPRGRSAASVVLGAGPALAGNAHFIASQTLASASGADLVVKFKEAGLESGSIVTIEVSAHLDATYQCINKGNHSPNDPKKTTIDSDVAADEPFAVPKNGNLRGQITLSAPAGTPSSTARTGRGRRSPR